MNDHFLYEVRRSPPPGFAKRLRRKLQQQKRPARNSIVRILMTVLFMSGFAMAASLLYVAQRQPSQAAAATSDTPHPTGPPVSSAASPTELDAPADGKLEVSAAARATASPVINPQPRRFIRNPPGITSPLARPLVEAILAQFAWMGGTPAPLEFLELQSEDPGAAFCVDSVRGGDASVVVTSHRITAEQLEECGDGPLLEVVESKIGYRAIVLARAPASAPLQVSARQVYLALSKWIPDPASPGKLILNRSISWDQIDSRLPTRIIQVFGPPRSSASYQFFARTLLEAGCDSDPRLRALKDTNHEQYAAACHVVRTDQAYREVASPAEMLSNHLQAEPYIPLVILDYRVYQHYRSGLIGTVLDGIEPSSAAFAAGTYPAARPIYIYLNTRHRSALQSALRFIDECCGERAGALGSSAARHDLAPLDDQERARQRERSARSKYPGFEPLGKQRN
jgi:phosphate transport system substrate-binding protein